MKDLKRPVFLGLAMLAATVMLSAQGQTQGQGQPIPIKKPQQTPTFRSATDIVSSDVVVRDERGGFIPGLTIKDFEVYEDGIKQKITAFSSTVGGRVMNEIVPVDESEHEGLVMPKVSRAPETPGRIFIIFIDDLHLQPLDTPMVKQVLKQIRDNLLHENDIVGLVSSGYSSISFDVSPDPQHLRFNQAIDKVMGAAMSYHEIINTAQTTEGPSGLRANAFTAFRVAYEILDQCERVTNRRKAFIYVSSGYDFNPLTDSRYKNLQDMYAQVAGTPVTVESTGTTANSRDPLSSMADATANPKLAFTNPFERGHLEFSESELNVALGELVRRAVRANVSFYPVDPRGLIAGSPPGTELTTDEWYKFMNTTLSSLDVLANETGGKCICRTNDFKKGIQFIDNDMSDYYMIGYESNNPDPMKVRRRIEVKVLRPGATVTTHKDSYTIKRR
jgi:VWFA-related protein